MQKESIRSLKDRQCSEMHEIFVAEIPACNSNPCLQGAQCVDGPDDYTCLCVSPYTGQRCEECEYSVSLQDMCP